MHGQKHSLFTEGPSILIRMKNRNKADRPSILFKLERILYFAIFSLCMKKVSGLENLSRDKAFIIASNHLSIIDGFLLTVYLTKPIDRNIHYLVSPRYYSNPFFRHLLETAEDIRLEPGHPAKSTYAALQCLKRGEIIGIFPEGIRSRDGKIQKGLPGVAHLALSARVPVVPVGLLNTHKYMPWGKTLPRFARMEIHVGKPMDFVQYYKEYNEAVGQEDQARAREIEEQVVRSIMKEIARLSNQEYPF